MICIYVSPSRLLFLCVNIFSTCRFSGLILGPSQAALLQGQQQSDELPLALRSCCVPPTPTHTHSLSIPHCSTCKWSSYHLSTARPWRRLAPLFCFIPWCSFWLETSCHSKLGRKFGGRNLRSFKAHCHWHPLLQGRAWAQWHSCFMVQGEKVLTSHF